MRFYAGWNCYTTLRRNESIISFYSSFFRPNALILHIEYDKSKYLFWCINKYIYITKLLNCFTELLFGTKSEIQNYFDVIYTNSYFVVAISIFVRGRSYQICPLVLRIDYPDRKEGYRWPFEVHPVRLLITWKSSYLGLCLLCFTTGWNIAFFLAH